MERTDAIHRVAASELTLHIHKSQQDGRRSPYKKRVAKVVDEDLVEIHEEKIIVIHPEIPDDESPHLDISA